MDTCGGFSFYGRMCFRQRSPLRQILFSSCLLVAVLLTISACSTVAQSTNAAAELFWRDARELTVEGKGWTDTKDFYDRLPARAESQVQSSVWRLSRDSAGLRVRFVTDATKVAVRWSLRNKSLEMPHMPASGMSGVDLYVKDKGGWYWLGAAHPSQWPTNEAVLISGLKASKRECALYLPLYNGVTEVKLGVAGGSMLEPAGSADAAKPVVFYGTSIVQGGCAARPGMAYPAILGRRLDCPTINLGFSGSAVCEPELAGLLAELNPSVYVLDPLPNMSEELVATRMESFVNTLRQAHPVTPIVLVENIEYANGRFVAQTSERFDRKNLKLREIYRRLIQAGQRKLYYVEAKKLIGQDGEATVDGVHPTDLGFIRMADAMEPALRRALKASR